MDRINKIARKKVELSDGRILTVGEWIGNLALKLPQSFKYNSGRKKGKLVDHFKELLVEFDKNGRNGVLKYVEDCYNLLNKAITKSIPQTKSI